MNTISKTHQRFSERLNNPKVLEYPQEFLGPNYKAVLDFWLFLDGLTEDQLKTITVRYRDFIDNHGSEWEKATDEAIKASDETIGWEFATDAALAAYFTASWTVKAAYWAACLTATRELIGMHRILEQQKPLTFFNMFLEL